MLEKIGQKFDLHSNLNFLYLICFYYYDDFPLKYFIKINIQYPDHSN